MNILKKAATVLFALTAALTFPAASLAATKIAPPPSDFKVSFIPKPWEVNVERGYLFLDNGWKFFKGSPQRIKSIDAASQGVSNPKKYKLRDGAEPPIGDKCEHPESANCDDSSWISVNVPFNWFDLGEDMDRFVGTVWYRKSLAIDEKQLKGRSEIQFWGVYYRAWVYVNGEKVGFHEGGYTPFSFDVTRVLKPGRNLIAVRVDNSIDTDDIRIGDWWNYGGIHREAMLVFTNASYIKDIDVRTTLSADLAKADVNFLLQTAGSGADEARAYVYRLSDTGKTLIGSVSRKISRTGSTPLPWRVSHPALWSPESPSLYFVKTVLFSNKKPIDGLGSIFGIRKFEVRGLSLFLNNKKVFFRGVNRHDEFFHGEFPDAGRVTTEQDRIKDFKLIKEMRANGMRTGHYPNHPYNYYITDRLGIMVIEEGGPVGGELDDDVLIDKIKTQMSEMVARDKNHPSIVIWSIGNEFGGDRFLKYIKAAAAYTRSIDSRPITFTETGDRIVTEGYRYVDILSRNEYAGWYTGGLPLQDTPAHLENITTNGAKSFLTRYHIEYPDKPVFIMEFGAESVCGRHAADPENRIDRGDEEYQLAVLKYQFNEILSHNYIAGTLPWVFADFKTQRDRGSCQFTPHLNRKGLVCTDRSKKLAFGLVRQVYESLSKK